MNKGKPAEKQGRKAKSLKFFYKTTIVWLQFEKERMISMKKFFALLMSVCMMLTAAATVCAAEKKYLDSDGYITHTNVSFYIQVNGERMDTEDNVKSQKKLYFTDIVATSELREKQKNNFSLAIGNTVSEDDICAYLTQVPDDSVVLNNVIEKFSTKGYIKSNTGNVINWSDLTTENYKSEWYVLKWENGDSSWHIDGRIIDLETQKEVEIVVPDNPEDIPEEAKPTPTPTNEPVPSDKPIDLNGVGYAYIFGYEPAIHRVDVTDEEGNVIGGKWVAEVQMAPDDAVTREQVASMIMRLIDQKYATKNDEYPVTDNIAKHAGTWYERGLAYLAGKGTFDGIDSVECGPVTRGEVAKLVAYGLNLSDTAETAFTDIADNQYKTYIEIMAAYGYMNGVSDDKFEPNRIMTRAEFCAMFNNIIGRTDMGLEGRDGTVVTPELYSIVDLNGHWAAETMLRATSAYDADGYVDIDTRLANIRNELDKYDSQKLF